MPNKYPLVIGEKTEFDNLPVPTNNGATEISSLNESLEIIVRQRAAAQLEKSLEETILNRKQDALPTPPPASVSIAGNHIQNNQISGDLKIVGIEYNLTNQTRNPAALIALMERSKQLTVNSPEYRHMIEELQSFLAPRPNRKVIGLEAKLNRGNRQDLIEDASYLENKFSRRLAQDQHSPSLQTLFLHCLSAINTAFCAHIQPLIKSGASPVVIDAAVKIHVIDPMHAELTSVDCSLTTEMVRGMLFFLTGKCHIQWE